MQPVNPSYADAVARIFDASTFTRDLGVELAGCGPGWCETTMAVSPRHLQQDGVVHAGVQATMADHTAGAAAGTLMPAGRIVLTIEFKVNLLRPASGDRLRCRADVLRPGKTVSVVESSVWARRDGEERLVAKATVTLAVTAPIA